MEGTDITGQTRLSLEYITSIGGRQKCLISSFIFNCVMNAILENALKMTDYSGTQMLPGGRVTQLDDALNHGDDAAKL